MATARFTVFLVLVFALAETAPDRAGLALPMWAGSLWASVSSLFLGAVARAFAGQSIAAGTAEPPQPTAAQKFARWRQSLTR